MKIYTRTGDDGDTALFGGGRVPKDTARVEAYGTVDELNAVLGVAVAADPEADWADLLRDVQHDLFTLGASLATPEARQGRRRPETPAVPSDRVSAMEQWIDRADDEAGPVRAFILPGGTRAAAALHHARTVCRRAERRVVTLARAEAIEGGVLPYLNRLSDLLFALARLANARAGAGDVLWRK
ncbi:MAG: cob(I)yrinic acid a,c-diamide adenosyltransferase [Gemmatimonadetes bacterium]|nr:MAG: cob(I)yrinic acid a,c-diamide adenosyltransferase [Gemmatimonadota bacterium]